MKKKIRILLVIIALLSCLSGFGQTVQAAAGKTSIAVSAGTLIVGDTVTVTVRSVSSGGGSAIATMTLTYNTSVLEFVSCSASDYDGGSGRVTASTDRFSVKLKAIAAGTSDLVLTAADGVDSNTNEKLESMEGSSTKIIVNNTALNNESSTNEGGNAAALSADNSLKKLTISSGTLSPDFSGSIVNYTATVGNDVTSVVVDAVPANQKAVVESISGNTSFVVGTNDVKIVVKAENGATATYTIKVSRLAENNAAPSESQEPEVQEPEVQEPTSSGEEVLVNNHSYQIADSVPEEAVPADFTAISVNYHGNVYQGLGFDKGTIKLLYLTNEEQTAGNLFIYDEARDAVYDFAKMNCGENYVIPLLAPADNVLPETYTQTSFQTAEGGMVQAFQSLTEDASSSDFYIFYGVNRDGIEGWYQYDSFEGTYQRSLNAFTDKVSEEELDGYAYLQEEYGSLSAKYKSERSKYSKRTAGFIIAIIILILIIINILIFGWRRLRGNQEDDEIGEDKEFEEKLKSDRKREIEKKKETKGKIKEKEASKEREKPKEKEEAKEREKKKETKEEEKAIEYEKEEEKEVDIIDLNDL